MKILNFKDFMKKCTLKNDYMKESELQIFYVYPIDPIVSRVYSDRDFVIIDNESQGGTHWTCFLVKDKKSNSYFDSFGGQPEKFLSNYQT